MLTVSLFLTDFQDRLFYYMSLTLSGHCWCFPRSFQSRTGMKACEDKTITSVCSDVFLETPFVKCLSISSISFQANFSFSSDTLFDFCAAVQTSTIFKFPCHMEKITVRMGDLRVRQPLVSKIRKMHINI